MAGRFTSTPRQALAAALFVVLPGASLAQDRELRMEVIGNRELPKSMVIVPWKAPTPEQAGSAMPRSLLVPRLEPLDPDEFARKLSRSIPGGTGSVPAGQ